MKISVKKIILALTVLLGVFCFVVGCDQIGATNVTVTKQTGAIGAFELTTPAAGESVYALPVFKWTAAQNADTYEFEIASSEEFSQTYDSVYVKKTGITDTQITLTSTIKEKNARYYWRVTAVNADGKKQSATADFYLAADEREILFDVNYADEWKVHEQGSNATISVDDSDFFGNGKNSLVVSFVEEDTKRGIPMSDGWIVVTHSQETEMYGVDAFYFNFYYSGNDADVFLRVVDEDNEYWHAQIKLANNAKQTVIIKFDDFELRTKGGTTIANQVFDYNYIKYVELVFEKSFGDGVAMISDLRAINYHNYGHLFIDEFDFSKFDGEALSDENYNFDKTISQDGSGMTYAFSGSANDKNERGINGYGFVKYPINKLLVGGDAFEFDLSFTGDVSKGNVLIRIIEEDGDRWVYRQRLSLLTGGSGHLVVPYMAFTLSEYHGDGSRQFYYVKQLQLGIESVYSTGSVTIGNMKVTSLKDEIADLYISEVDDNGVIDDFNGYKGDVELYYKWMLSDTNKDEAMAIEKSLAFGTDNICAKLGYKADMGQASYATTFASPAENYTAVSLWAMDRSLKSDEAVFNYIDEVTPQMIVALYVSTGEEYHTTVDKISKSWTEYTLAFSDFTLAEGYFGQVTPLAAENIVAIRIGFQYYYYAKNGSAMVPHPTYISGNYVYVDNVRFTADTESGVTELAHKLKPSEDDPNVCVIETFDDATADMLPIKGEKGYEYESVTLSDDTASGEGKSVKLSYQGNQNSPSYGINMIIDGSVTATAVKILMKGDGKSTVYINVFMDYAGTTYKYRATITNVAAEWTVYTIGFDNFTKEEGTGNVALSPSRAKYITKITIGIYNNKDSEMTYIYIDGMALDNSVSGAQGVTQFKKEKYEGSWL